MKEVSLPRSASDLQNNPSQTGSELSPEALLSEGLATKIDKITRDLGERTLPLNKAPYTASPYYIFPPKAEDPVRRTLQTNSFSFNPDVRGVSYGIRTATFSRNTSLKTSFGPHGSFQVITDITEGEKAYRIGLDYVAPDPDQATPAHITFFDTSIMAPNELQLPPDSPDCKKVLDQLLADIQATEEAVAEFETIEASKR